LLIYLFSILVLFGRHNSSLWWCNLWLLSIFLTFTHSRYERMYLAVLQNWMNKIFKWFWSLILDYLYDIISDLLFSQMFISLVYNFLYKYFSFLFHKDNLKDNINLKYKFLEVNWYFFKECYKHGVIIPTILISLARFKNVGIRIIIPFHQHLFGDHTKEIFPYFSSSLFHFCEYFCFMYLVFLIFLVYFCFRDHTCFVSA